MPLYDMKCENCKEEFSDQFVKSGQEHYAAACPKCRKIGSLKKLPPRSNFVVRGYSASNGYSEKKS